MSGHQQSKKIGRNIRAPFDIIDVFGLPLSAIKKQIYDDHNKDNPNPRLNLVDKIYISICNQQRY